MAKVTGIKEKLHMPLYDAFGRRRPLPQARDQHSGAKSPIHG